VNFLSIFKLTAGPPCIKQYLCRKLTNALSGNKYIHLYQYVIFYLIKIGGGKWQENGKYFYFFVSNFLSIMCGNIIPILVFIQKSKNLE